MNHAPKLIILRGPSGSGKSTVAERLFEQAKNPTVLIQQDHYRFIFNPPGGTLNSKSIHKMIKANVLTALEDGYGVILEGIFTMKSYGHIFEELFRKHQTENYVFTFDISFAETVRRHATRKTANMFTEKDMEEWYPASGPAGYEFERIIPESSTLDETVATIKQTTDI